eukprot:gnl/TRDRNA2_/TRDRNA2_156501_c0_seq1.p2 gnl/TRDRNA2_/TRDRNA2_156501_c0~~gnl/TRDRNA2_/TRDRNA2_156501_c0_seq1.p2  ORF type:complete len:121 (+),score=21.42 gnl/TRDRNA2_/TRDRNA2_156501_c0_seq1:165-527(+)
MSTSERACLYTASQDGLLKRFRKLVHVMAASSPTNVSTMQQAPMRATRAAENCKQKSVRGLLAVIDDDVVLRADKAETTEELDRAGRGCVDLGISKLEELAAAANRSFGEDWHAHAFQHL